MRIIFGQLVFRGLAALIDLIIVAIAVSIVLLAFGFEDVDPTDPKMNVIVIISYIGYYIFFEAAYGNSPGKRCTRQRVIMTDGSPITPKAALVRNLVRILDLQLAYLVAIAPMLINRNTSRFGDMMADTRVIRYTTRRSPADEPVERF